MKINATLLLFFIINTLNGQNRNDEIQNIYEAVFLDVGRNSISTGYLFDKTYHLSNLNKFDGRSDTFLLSNSWKKIYYELQNFRASETAYEMPPLDSTAKKIEKEISNKINPLLIFDFNYNKIKDDAFDKGILFAQDKKIHQNSAITESPFIEKDLFAFTPAMFSMGNGPVNFKISPEYYYSNFSSVPTNGLPELEIDLDDGKGFSRVTWDETITLQYEDNRTREIKLRKVATNQISYSQYQNNSKLHDLKFNLEASERSGINNFIHETGQYISGYAPYGGETASGLVTVSYAYDNYSAGGRRTCLKKPVIFVEGIDFQFTGLPNGFDATLGKCNSLGYVDIKSEKHYKYCDKKESDKYYQQDFEYNLFEYSSDLIENLNNNGYDFVYLDFVDGATYMQANALVLVNLILEINKMKCGCEENVVVGASMGGQVSRYALSYMEQNHLPHGLRLYTSFDSPNNGANIPVGFLAMIDYFSTKNFYPLRSFKENKEGRIDRPATQQLIIGMGNGQPSSLRHAFLTELGGLGSYPQKCRKISIVNSSGIGTPQNFNPGDKLYDFDIPVATAGGALIGPLIGGSAAQIIAGIIGTYIVKNYSATGYAAQGGGMVFKGTAPFDGTSTLTLPSDFLNWDSSPGSQNDAIGTSAQSCLEHNSFFNLDFPSLEEIVGTAILQPKIMSHCFMPISSTLGLKPPYDKMFDFAPAYNISADDPNPIYTLFDAYYAPQQNEPHVKITEANTDWFMEQLEINSNNLVPELKTTYNFGNKFRKTLYSVDVWDDGHLKVNGTGNTDYQNAAATSNGSTFELNTLECSQVLIFGKFTLGESNPNNKAVVRFKKGSVLQIKGTLTINDNSRLIMEEGSTLIISPLSEIKLIGPNAILEIKGNLKLEDYTNFTLPLPENGDRGKIVFSSSNPSENKLICGQDVTISLEGKNKNDEILVINQEILTLPNNLELFKVFKAAVNFKSSNGFISIGAKKYILENSKFFNDGTEKSGHGLTAYGQADCIVNNCLFSNLLTGFSGLLFYWGNPLKITNSNFERCGTGVYNWGAGMDLSGNLFNQCGTGWYGNGLSLNNYVEECRFIQNGTGLSAWGDNNVLLSINKSTFKKNNWGVEVTDGLYLQSKCTYYNENYEYGINAGYNCTVNLSRNFNAGNNTFAKNGLAIFLYRCKDIKLRNGMNSFSGYQPGSCISQGFYCNPVIQGSISQSSCQGPVKIDVSGNFWGNISETSTLLNKIIKIGYLYNNVCQYPIPVISKGQMTLPNYPSIYYCLTMFEAINKKENVMKAEIEACPTCPIIMTPDFEGVRLDHAANTALEKIETSGEEDHHKALDLFHQILFFPLENPGEQEKRILEISYQKMRESLAEEIIKKHPDSPQDLEKMRQITNKFHDQAVIEENLIQASRLKTDRSYLEKLKEDWEKAIIPLMEIESFNIPELTGFNSIKLCFTGIERDVKTGILAKEKFVESIKLCLPNSQISPQSTPFQDSQDEGNLNGQDIGSEFSVYPNPTSGKIEIIHSKKENYIFEVFDLSGKKLVTHSINNLSDKIDFKLKDGIYFYMIKDQQNTILSNKKLIIINP